MRDQAAHAAAVSRSRSWERGAAWLVSLAFCLGVSACSPNSPTVGDSKTNWLLACDRNVDCDAPSVCVCHVCTRPCVPDADACESLGATALCTMPEVSVCDTGGVSVCLPACSEGCIAPAQCVDNVCLEIPTPWSITPPRSLRLVRCMMPVGSGCAAGNEVYQLMVLNADGSVAVSDPLISGTWTSSSDDDLLLTFERAGAEPVTFPGAASTEPGCFEGDVNDPNMAQATTFTACLLP